MGEYLAYLRNKTCCGMFSLNFRQLCCGGELLLRSVPSNYCNRNPSNVHLRPSKKVEGLRDGDNLENETFSEQHKVGFKSSDDLGELGPTGWIVDDVWFFFLSRQTISQPPNGLLPEGTLDSAHIVRTFVYSILTLDHFDHGKTMNNYVVLLYIITFHKQYIYHMDDIHHTRSLTIARTWNKDHEDATPEFSNSTHVARNSLKSCQGAASMGFCIYFVIFKDVVISSKLGQRPSNNYA